MIPKTIHQIWIGDKPIPDNVKYAIETWKEKNPGCEHKLWTNENVEPIISGMPYKHLYPQYAEGKRDRWNGCANLLRYEILYRFGGVYVDADSHCLQTLPIDFFSLDFWVAYENERRRPGLISNAFIGSTPKHKIIQRVRNTLATRKKVVPPSWKFSGPQLLTDVIKFYRPAPQIYPSYYFMPRHARDSKRYDGTAPVYADHFWGNSEGAYTTGMVNALMITGLPGRDKLARIAIDNFHEQTYEKKQLIIVNDGKYTFGNSDGMQEIPVKPGHRLGALRNISQDAVKQGEYIIQWDDDDYRHPSLIEQQLCAHHTARSGFTVLKRQIRYSLKKNAAWIEEGKGRGIHGTPLYTKRSIKYPDKRIGEDTGLLNQYFRECASHVWDNPAHLYVRIIHTRNTWHDGHFQLDRRKENHWNIDEQHKDWLRTVKAKYEGL